MQTTKKHLLGRLLAFLAVAFVTTGMAWAQVSVSVSSVTGRPGETVTVPVNISNVTSVNSFQFTVNTGTDLTYAGYDATGTLAAGFALSPSATTSGTSVTVGGFNNGGGAITADGTLLNLTFTLGAGTGAGNVTLDATEFDGVAPAGGASVAVPYVISNIFIDAADVTVRLTDPAAITVNAVDAVTNLAAFTVDVTVGPEFGAPVTVAAGTLTAGWTTQINPLGGDVYRVGGFGPAASGSGSLFVLNGTAAAVGTRAVTFSNLDFTDNLGGNIPVGADAGTFTVVTNSPPVATAQSVTLDEDDSQVITLAGTDANGDPLTFAIATNPTNGTLSAVTGATVTYTPTANYNGTDSFTFTANDGLATSAAATVSITVNAVNDVPTVTDPPATTTAEDTDATITLTGADDDGDTLTFAVATAPTNGSVVITGNTATYSPNANYNGADSFTFTATDGTATSAPGTASITVTAVNDAPVVADGTIATAEDTDGTVTLTSTDVEGDAVTYSVGTAPTNGTVTIAGDVATYSPNANYNGGDSFTVVGNDGTDDSAPATITVTVTAVNDAPTATAIAQTTAEDTPADVTLLGADVDGDALTYTVSAATNGTVTVAGAVATYTPNADFAGADSFTYTVSDGTLSATETVTMTVTPTNDAPVVADGTITTDEDTDGTATLTSTDADGDAVTYSVGTAPTNGTVTIAGDVATYSPNANYNGGDSFTVVGNDGTVDSAPATITVTVTAVNDAPTAAAIAQTTAEDTAADVTLLGADVDGDALAYSVSAPTNGTVTVTLAGAVAVATYTPNADFNGTDSFTYTVSDGTLSATETVTMTVSATNDAPVVDDKVAASDEDTDATVTLTGTDTEGDAITFAIDTAPTNGTVTLTGADAVYSPNADFNGTDSFTYTGSDGTATSAAATVTITVNAVNDAPVFTAELADMTILEDAPLNFTYVATDVDGDALTFNVVSPATATIDGSGAFSWSAVGSVGSNSVQVSVSDGTVTVESTIATVMVLPVDGFRLNFAGVHENPPVATPASGSGMIRVVESAGTLEISATVEGLSGAFAAAHIHSAPVGDNGPVLLSLTGVPSADGRSVTFNQTIDLATALPAGTTPADFIASLRAGQAYVNVHSSAHGSGEVRSQILAADNQAPSAVAVRAPSDVTISGNGDDRLYSVSWLPATDPNGDAVNYIYQVSLTAGFSDIEGAINFGDGNGFRVTVAEAAALYDEVTDANPGMVDVGGSVTLYHRMVTTDGGLWTAGPVESITLTRGTVTANEGEVDLPTEFALKGNYPNPFNPSTSIQFDLPEAADVTVVVSDMLGRQVLSVPSAALEAGSNRSIQVDASGLASGLYLYRVVARSAQTTFAKVGTMTLIK